MDWDDRLILDNKVSSLLWIRRLNQVCNEKLTDWMTTLHKDRLSCKLAAEDYGGSHNAHYKVAFDNGEKWMVRFPIVGRVTNADEKVENEIAAMKLIRRQTSIPIPDIKAWGKAADNPLGVGPFIVMEFIEGICAWDILREGDTILMRGDVDESVLETLMRQAIGFQLQLQQLSFPRIGSFNSASDSASASTISSRPLTEKAHEILTAGGVNLLDPRSRTYSSTTEYFHHIVKRDLEHLHMQPNSVDDAKDAREKFIYWNVMKALIARHVEPSEDHGPFKFMCDNFGLMNLIVNNEQDLKVIAVIDWEWSYAAPAQMAHSMPLWLLVEPPTVWTCVDDGTLTRFNEVLELYTRILKEEEQNVIGAHVNERAKPSALLKKDQEQGRQWFHCILIHGFNGPTCVPFVKLREETADWDELAAAVPEDEITAFVEKKCADLQTYKMQLAETEERYKVALHEEWELEDLAAFLDKSVKALHIDRQRYHWRSWDCFGFQSLQAKM
ncbi:hypothetical protein F4777DRAFT_495602 [Nemania sp. FL0916]|nr:hypothetical protein F4777DRAFT_495602 [Nemania sp. FL0916]